MKKISFTTVVLVALLFSCKKNFDKPATQEEIQNIHEHKQPKWPFTTNKNIFRQCSYQLAQYAA
jgi:hypothetical protein